MASVEEDSGLSLSELFYAGWEVQKKVENAEIVASNKDFNVSCFKYLKSSSNIVHPNVIVPAIQFLEQFIYLQTIVSDGIQQLEEATKLVSRLDLFSKNEMVEEVSTADLKYLYNIYNIIYIYMLPIYFI